MSKADGFENGLLLLIFNNTTYSTLGDATGLVGSGSAGSLYLSLHTADPGEAGSQTTSEITYTSYARAAVARTSGGFTVSSSAVNLTSAISFPAGTGGSGTATYFGIGTASSGTGKLLYSGTLTPNVVCGSGITPQITTAANLVTED